MKTFIRTMTSVLAIVVLYQCKPGEKKEMEQEKTEKPAYPALGVGKLEAFDEAFWQLIPRDAPLEILAEGHEWTEGPLWVPDGNYLLYTDIPRNAIYQWKEGEGAKVFLQPSGFMGEDFQGKEPGANGLLLDKNGKLVLCQHGERQMARMSAPLNKPAPEFETLADTYEQKRFNSPNDAVFKSNGDLYFTDPPYGLPMQAEDPDKELDFQGVYKLGQDGKVSLLTRELTRPNGIAFSRDEKLLYVANSDPEKAIWMVYDIGNDGLLQNGQLFYDATSEVANYSGLPDGLKVHRTGTIFATGPGGVLVFSPQGLLLGRINTGQATSNCALDRDEGYLYITADSYLLRLQLKH